MPGLGERQGLALSKSQRTKGASFERWTVNRFKRAGFLEAQRNLNDTTDGRGVDVETHKFAIQCKSYKKPPNTSKIEEVNDDTRFHLLVAKGDYTRATVTMYLDDWLSILNDVGLAWGDYNPAPF